MRKKAMLVTMVWAFLWAPPTLRAQGLTHDHAAMHSHGGAAGVQPAMPGQDLFGAITEIVGILNADPATDWSRVDVDALRSHLLDMHLVATEADPTAERVPGGLRFALKKTNRAGAAAERMLAAHGPILEATFGWRAQLQSDAREITWTVTAPHEPADEVKIRALGFFGLLASGAHHQEHHLAIARGTGHPHGDVN